MIASEGYAQQITNRYIYAVSKRLPYSQREDIKQELRGLIDDMLAERHPDGNFTSKEIDDVLMQLGAPEKLAAQYTGGNRYLIGPELYETYRTIILVVLVSVAFGMTIAHVIMAFISPQENPLSMIGGYLFNTYIALLQAFAFTTIGFVISDYFNRKNNKPPENWYPNMLPELPEAVKGISKSDPIAGMVFTVLVILLFNAAPWLMGAIVYTDSLHVVPIFNLEYLKTVVIWFNICFVLGVMREIAKLVIGQYTVSFSLITLLLDIAALSISVPILSSSKLWNHNLVTDLAAVGVIPEGINLSMFWNGFMNFFYLFIVFAFLLDIITVIVHTVRAQRNSF